MVDLATPIETPSGKWSSDENFPVASRLISPRLRPHVMVYYAFARTADDIADASDLTEGEKIRRLDAMEAGLLPGAAGPAPAVLLRESMDRTGVPFDCARDLLVAFRQDARKSRYASWEDLLDYCRFSASPVGRYLLRLHDEDPHLDPTGDALCAALQVLNHLQDIGDDRNALDRIYLPEDWMREAGVSETDLDAEESSDGLRGTIDRCLDGCDALLDRSAPLAARIRSRRLGAEVAVIHSLAVSLSARLRREDPLAGRVGHGALDLAGGLLAGLSRLAGAGSRM